jgi:hypothetical protein
MIRHRCPLCEHVIASSDDVVGLTIRCPSCEATHRVPAESELGLEAAALPAPLPELEKEPGLFEEVWADVTGASASAAPEKEVSPVATEEPCAFCEQVRPDTKNCYLRVAVMDSLPVVLRKALVQFPVPPRDRVTLQCPCCEACFARGARVWPWRLIVGLGLLLLPIPALILLLVLLPQGQFSAVAPWGVLAALGLVAASVPLTALHQRFLISRLWTPEMDRQVRERVGNGGWGLKQVIRVYRRPPSD